MSTSKPFHLGDILTVATGKFCTPNGMDGVYALCKHMVGEPVMTHQLPRVGRECEPELYRQHPDLRGIDVPQFAGEADGMVWLNQMIVRYGEYHDVEPLPAVDHTSINPVAEFRMHNPNTPIIEV